MRNHILSLQEIIDFVDRTSMNLLIKKEPQTIYNPINYLVLKKRQKYKKLTYMFIV